MSYDQAIKQHYDAVAEQVGSEPTSTMADIFVRKTETDVICDLVASVAEGYRRERDAEGGFSTASEGPLTVLDVGCGNGYTLETLQKRIPGHRYFGVEYNDKLREIAAKRANVTSGDLRDLSSIAFPLASADIIVCQRVIINLLDLEDQRAALENVFALAKHGAILLFIETFQSGLENLNAARSEFGLSPIPPAIHNLPLPDNFFDAKKPFREFSTPRNILSTHFFVTRILHEIAIQSMKSPFTRNSHFVQFMSAALPEAVGDYSPLQFRAFINSQSY